MERHMTGDIPDDNAVVRSVAAEVIDSPDEKEENNPKKSKSPSPDFVDGEIIEGDNTASDNEETKPETNSGSIWDKVDEEVQSETTEKVLKERKLLEYLDECRKNQNEYLGVYDYVINGRDYADRPDFLDTREDLKEMFSITDREQRGKYKSSLKASHDLIEYLAKEALVRLHKKENLKNSSNLADQFFSQLSDEVEGTDKEKIVNDLIDTDPEPVLSKKKKKEAAEAAAKLEADKAAEDAKKAEALLDTINPASTEDLHSLFDAIDMTAGIADFDQDVFDRIMTEANLDEEEKLLLRKQHKPYAYGVMSREEKNKLAAAVAKVRAVAKKIKSEKSEPKVEDIVETISATDLDKILEAWFSHEIKGAKFDFKYNADGIHVEVKKERKLGKKPKNLVTFDIQNKEDDITISNIKVQSGLNRSADGISIFGKSFLKSGKADLVLMVPEKIRQYLEEKDGKNGKRIIKKINVDEKGLNIVYVKTAPEPEKSRTQRVKEAASRYASNTGKAAVAAGRATADFGKYAVKDSGELGERLGEVATSLASQIGEIPKNVRSYREQRKNKQGMTGLGLRDDSVDSKEGEDAAAEDLDLNVNTSNNPEAAIPDTIPELDRRPIDTDGIIRDFFSYQDIAVPGESEVYTPLPPLFAKEYAESIQELSMRYNLEAVKHLADTLRSRMIKEAERLGIEVSPQGNSISWAMIEIGRQNYFYTHPEGNYDEFEPGDPMTSEVKQQEIIDRELGIEAGVRNMFNRGFREKINFNPAFSEAKKILDSESLNRDYTKLGRILREANISDVETVEDGNVDDKEETNESRKPEGSNAESNEKPKPVQFATEKGSVYTYLPDGRTKRYKKATGEEMETQDFCVFVPPWDEIKDTALRLYPEILSGVENEVQFDQVLLTYVQEEGYTVRITDRGGNVINNIDQLNSAEETFIYLIDKKDNTKSFAIPVSREPKIGYSTYDQRIYEEGGESKSERHLGNKVVDIQYSN